jgi:hypothetical protein
MMQPWQARAVVLSLICLLVSRILDLLRIEHMSEAEEDIEILVLRHRLAILRRQAGRVRYNRADRTVLAGLGRLRPESGSGSATPPGRGSRFVCDPAKDRVVCPSNHRDA